MIRRDRRRRLAPAVSVVSMADIAFLLIIFFMVTTSFSRGPQLEVQLAEAKTGERSAAATAVTIVVGPAGAYEVDGRQVAKDQLAADLGPRLAALHQPLVVVAADRAVPWEHVVFAMDTARGLGVERLELSVREPGR